MSFFRSFLWLTFQLVLGERVSEKNERFAGSFADPCTYLELESCTMFLNKFPSYPIPNRHLKTVNASPHYKFSIDVFCNHTMDVPLADYVNIFHVTPGGNWGNPGDRTFAMLRHPHRLGWANQRD